MCEGREEKETTSTAVGKKAQHIVMFLPKIQVKSKHICCGQNRTYRMTHETENICIQTQTKLT